MLDSQLQDLIILAMTSHESCGHDDPALCFTLCVLETEIRLLRELTNEEAEESRLFFLDQILEGLILKGMVEPTGLNEEGDFVLGLTEQGRTAYERSVEKGNSSGN